MKLKVGQIRKYDDTGYNVIVLEIDWAMENVLVCREGETRKEESWICDVWSVEGMELVGTVKPEKDGMDAIGRLAEILDSKQDADWLSIVEKAAKSGSAIFEATRKRSYGIREEIDWCLEHGSLDELREVLLRSAVDLVRLAEICEFDQSHLPLDGQDWERGEDWQKEAFQAAVDNKKIKGIKAIRAGMGSSLEMAKDLYETIFEGTRPVPPKEDSVGITIEDDDDGDIPF